MTNLLTHNEDYHHCARLWSFLETQGSAVSTLTEAQGRNAYALFIFFGLVRAYRDLGFTLKDNPYILSADHTYRIPATTLENEDFLVEGDDGYLHFTPSYSPENAPANTGSQACVDATMDLAVARELFTNLLTACRTLGVEGGSLPKWESILRRLPPYRVNDDGALSEWACPALEDCYDHRHASHLYPLFYGISREFRENRRLFDACRRTYEIKNERKKKEKGVMAFGMVQAGLAAAHLGDAAALGETIEALAANHYYRTFATSHDAGPSIFNADLSGGMPALMLEALAQSYEAVGPEGTIDSYDIVLLPALPSFWPSGSVTGMHLRGGFALSLWWENGRVARYELENPLGNPYRVESGEEYFTRLRREAGE